MPAFAQERDPAALPLNVKPPKKPKAFSAGLRETYYLADESTLLGEKHFEELTMRIRGQGQAEYISAAIDIGASYAFNIPDYMSIFAPEGYFRFLMSDNPTPSTPLLTFGRKKDRWSLLDSYWELGTWQPLYRWDYLRPEEQGLIGAFLELPIQEARILLFATPLYVPETGPNYKIRNNKLTSDNPWFFEPTEQILVISKTNATDVRYDPHIPPIEEIVLNAAIGGSLELGARTAGSWLRTSYIYKPRNQLALPFEGALQLSGSSSPYIDVDIYPKVLYHNLFATDVGYKDETFSVWLSSLYDLPVENEMGSNFTYQRLEPTFFLSPGIEISQVSDGGFGYGFMLSYLTMSGEESSEVGQYASPDNPVFTAPYFFKNALRGAARVSFPMLNKLRSSAGVTFTQSFEDDASWVKLTSEWKLTDRVQANLEGDFIGSLAPRGNSNFLSRYRGNDRVLASGSYIF